MQTIQLLLDDTPLTVRLLKQIDDEVEAEVNGKMLNLRLVQIDDHICLIDFQGMRRTAHYASDKKNIYVAIAGNTFVFEKPDLGRQSFAGDTAASGENIDEVKAPMPGKILKMLVKPGEKISQNQSLFILEAMKMENDVKAPRDGVVGEVLKNVGDLVAVGDAIIKLVPVEK
jgi:biotin carboxyl carrier protein